MLILLDPENRDGKRDSFENPRVEENSRVEGPASGHRNKRMSRRYSTVQCLIYYLSVGKTTLVQKLVKSLTDNGYKCASISMDDFYHSNTILLTLSTNTSNPLLKYRGNFGTHDHELLYTTLTDLRNPECASVVLPSYDKSLNSGRGDRVKGTPIKKPLDISK